VEQQRLGRPPVQAVTMNLRLNRDGWDLVLNTQAIGEKSWSRFSLYGLEDGDALEAIVTELQRRLLR
jgi:hypothetical protein